MIVVRTERITLPNGTDALVRPLRRGDAPALRALHERASADSLYLRYLSPRTPTLSELEEVSALNENGGGAFAVTRQTAQGETIVGFAYYVALDEHTAEPAILIEDGYQRQGLGRRLMRRLRQHALAQGIRVFSATVYPQNRAVLGLIRSTGLPYEVRSRYGAREVTMHLKPRAVSANGSPGPSPQILHQGAP